MFETKEIISLINGTCSSYAATEYKEKLESINHANISIRHVNSFYEGLDLLNNSKNHNIVMLVPHVHELCATLTMHPDFELIESDVFKKENPPLYLAESHKKELPMNEKRCASIHTLKLLVSDSYLVKIKEVNNTQEAAKSVYLGESGYCITNEHGLKLYDLVPVERLKQMTIFWFPFRWAGNK